MVTTFNTEYVDTLPLRKQMVENTIYLSEKSWISTHLCANGCGEEIMTPHIRGGYHYYTDEQDRVTYSEEIHCDKCKSRYNINKGYAII